jgi:rare lipoprotein A
MRKLVMGCAVAGLIALSPNSEAQPPRGLSALAELPIYVPKPEHEIGLASWYGAELQNSPTASGELFDMNELTAAHRDLPLGTRIKVTNVLNHKSIILRINDRGPNPNLGGRLVDVSMAAAEKLGFLRAGLTRVEVSVVSVPTERPLYANTLSKRWHTYSQN